jgi:hypothetical protein
LDGSQKEPGESDRSEIGDRAGVRGGTGGVERVSGLDVAGESG